MWFAARHDSIPANLAPSVVPALTRLRALSPPLLIGAITNGNGNPAHVPSLAPFFDFCVNSEGVGISKPAPEIYRAAHERILAAGEPGGEGGAIGPWWVHVGDDLVKDCVASKELGCRTVLTREFALMKEEKERREGGKKGDTFDVHIGAGKPSVFGADATTKELQPPMDEAARLARLLDAGSDLRMQIGADDYLAASMRDEFCDHVCDTFENVVDIVEQWRKV